MIFVHHDTPQLGDRGREVNFPLLGVSKHPTYIVLCQRNGIEGNLGVDKEMLTKDKTWSEVSPKDSAWTLS